MTHSGIFNRILVNIPNKEKKITNFTLPLSQDEGAITLLLLVHSNATRFAFAAIRSLACAPVLWGVPRVQEFKGEGYQETDFTGQSSPLYK